MYLHLNLHFFLTKRDLWEKLPLLTFVKSGCGVMWHFYVILYIFFHFVCVCVILYIFCNVLIAIFHNFRHKCAPFPFCVQLVGNQQGENKISCTSRLHPFHHRNILVYHCSISALSWDFRFREKQKLHQVLLPSRDKKRISSFPC